MYIGRHVKYSSVVMKFEFSRQILERYPISDLIKIHPVAAELFHANRRTDGRTERHDEAISRFFKILRTRLK